MFTIRDANPTPLAVTRRPRPGWANDIKQIQWHSTRGNTANDLQVQATENWFAHPANDLGGWGGSADFVLGHDRRIGGKIEIVQLGHWWDTFSSWSAGYGASFTETYGAAQFGVAIEVAQSVALEDYDDEVVEACIFLVNYINSELERLGVPPVPPTYIPYWSQSVREPIPEGHVFHQWTANGTKLGKTDPGDNFPIQRILDGLKPKPVLTYEDGLKQGRVQALDEMQAALNALRG